MAPPARGPVVALTAQEVEADVELVAAVAVFAGAFVVVRADLEERQQTKMKLRTEEESPPPTHTPQAAAKNRSAATAGRAASLTAPEGCVASAVPHCGAKPNCGLFHMLA